MNINQNTVVVSLSNGVVESVVFALGGRVVLLDSDTEGGDEENITEVNGEEVYVSTFTSDGTVKSNANWDPQLVNNLVAQAGLEIAPPEETADALRAQAAQLMKAAHELDGKFLVTVVHDHRHGTTIHHGYVTDLDDAEVAKQLEIDFAPNQEEYLQVELFEPFKLDPTFKPVSGMTP